MLKKIIIYITLAYSILGFIALPLLLKPQIIETIQKETNSKIFIDSISFNPFIFQLEIEGLVLNSLEEKHLISFESLLVNFELYSLFNSTIHLKDIILKKPKISLVYESNKSINLLSIIKKKKKEPEQKESEPVDIPRIKLDNIAVVDGVVEYKDFTNASDFDFEFSGIGFNLKDVDTADINSSDAELRFYALLGDGGFIDLKSKVIGFEPLAFEGSFDFEASKLYTQWRYLKDSLNLEVADGKLSLHTNYYVNLADLNASKLTDASLYLDALRIKPKAKYKDILNLKSFHVDGVTLEPIVQKLHIKSINLNSLNVKAKRDDKGVVDWLEYIKSNNSKLPKETRQEETNSTKKWDVVVDEVTLEKIAATFEDKAISPSVRTQLDELNISLHNVTLLGEKPFSYKIESLVNSHFKCQLKGDIAHKKLDANANIECHDLDIVHYRPYIDKIAKESLKTYNVKLIKARLDFKSKISFKDENGVYIIDVKDSDITLSKLALNRRSNSRRLVNLNAFKVRGMALNSKKKSIEIDKISVDYLDIKGKKYKNGSLNFEGLIEPKFKKRKKTVSKKETPYRVKLKHFALKGAKVDFYDSSLTPRVKSSLDKIYVNAYKIDSQKRSWLSYNMSARVNKKGFIKSKGALRHTPLRQKGTLELQKISLKEINPYIAQSAFVELSDGFLSLKSKTDYSPSQKKADLHVVGSLKVEEFFLHDSRDKKQLLSFNEFGLKSFNLEALPNRLLVDEANINGFYVDVAIDENKSLNFASLMKEKEPKEELVVDENETKQESTFPFGVMKLTINSGSAEFSDMSIPIKFKTDIHDLNGVIYSISNAKDETSYLEIEGEVDEYGSTKLKGSLNSANPKEYTDLDFNFKNLELSSLSGYSASFAGHELDGGKLYLDLGYEILNSELKGSNSVIIKKIKLGKEIEDENTSSLPMGFIIGLLEDKDGIIDIDMPVEGNVDEPDFKYGALVFKTLGNLLVKAVTSPFTFLGSMMGINGDELEYLEFEAGEKKISAPQREKLDQIVKMMIKRPKISLIVEGKYDDILDAQALQKEKLITLILKKSGIKSSNENKNVMNVDVLEEIYEESKGSDKLDALEEGIHKEYKENLFKRKYLSKLIEESLKLQSVTKLELEKIATLRAEVIQEYLVKEKSINIQRVNVLKSSAVQEHKDKLIKVNLTIEVKE